MPSTISFRPHLHHHHHNGSGSGINTNNGRNASVSPTNLPVVQPSTTTGPTTTNRARATSDFDLSLMPLVHRRTLYPWSVHRSVTTHKYIATIARPEPGSTTNNNKVQHLQFPFTNEREAKKFCKAYSPPKLQQVNTPNESCSLCNVSSSSRHCRNCGSIICDRCTRRWGLRMVPKTYYNSTPTALTVRVCKSCDWLSNAFCMALLQGRFQDAVQIYETGNVNLRTCFADIHREAMFPIHCAVMGGSLELVRWLVDTHMCPITRNNKGQLQSVQTSASRTLLDLAMTGKPKVEILLYLVSKGLSIHDAKDPTLAPKTLEAILKAGPIMTLTQQQTTPAPTVAVIEDMELDLSVTTAPIDDPCAICCEKSMDCVLVPCGHQICCTECGQQINVCPICKVDCTVLRVFKP